MLDNYLDKNGKLQWFSKAQILHNQAINKRLDYMYERLVSYFDIPYVIDFCKDAIATETHKWGLAPMHYCDAYYKRVLEEIYHIVDVKK